MTAAVKALINQGFQQLELTEFRRVLLLATMSVKLFAIDWV
jgi:hypothetical protein